LRPRFLGTGLEVSAGGGLAGCFLWCLFGQGVNIIFTWIFLTKENKIYFENIKAIIAIQNQLIHGILN
jgi:hypothetical protein